MLKDQKDISADWSGLEDVASNSSGSENIEEPCCAADVLMYLNPPQVVALMEQLEAEEAAQQTVACTG